MTNSLNRDREKVNTTNTTYSDSSELTIDSMVLSIKQLEIDLKISSMVETGNPIVAYFPKRFRRPKWLIEKLKENKIKSKRSSYLEDRNFYLLDESKFHFWDFNKPIKPL